MEISWANGAANIRNSCKTISLPAIFSSTISWHGGIRLRASNLLSSPTPLCDVMEDVQLDARKRQFIWSDAERLDIVQSVARIHQQYPDMRPDRIEEYLLDWMEMDYAPEHYSKAQLDELDRLTARWIADHFRRAKRTKRQRRTRHS